MWTTPPEMFLRWFGTLDPQNEWFYGGLRHKSSKVVRTNCSHVCIPLHICPFTMSSLELFLFVSNSHPSHPAQIHKTARFFSTFTLLWSKIMQCSQYLVPYLFGLSWWSSAMVTYTIGTCLAIFMECMVFLAAVIMKTMGSATELIGVTTAVVHSNISVGYWSRNMETK